jgi:LytS/YehU family sensor histidine kinase
MEVANTGRLGAGGNGEAGVGLANLRRRLSLEYPGRHRFALAQDGDWVRAVIELEEAR